MTARSRFSSLGLLLILTAVWTAGVCVLDCTYLRPAASWQDRLTLLLVSAGMGLVLILAAGSLLVHPLARLLDRVRQVEAGEAMPDDFTQNLHAEPLALARRLQGLFRSMLTLSWTDALTGLANRRQFDHRLQQAFQEARRYQRPLSVVMIDVDLFKAVNDTAGHKAGDDMLAAVSQVIRRCCRQVDLPARLGGDEFAILLPETTSAGAAVVAGRIRQSLGKRTFLTDGSEIKITLSVGIADMNSDRIETPESLVELADRALRAAKDLGRNRDVQAYQLKEAAWGDGRESERSGTIRQRLMGLDTQFKALFLRAVEEIVQVMERRDPFMADHARKVRQYSVLIARRMGMPDQVVKRIELAALLHDVGMLCLPDSLLLHPGRLNEQQREALERHPLGGARILEGMEFLDQVVSAVRTHHERFDGKGYPDGLVGHAIPLPARVVAVADAFDAMISPRSFRGAKSPGDALAEVQAASGSQFDPAAVEAFLSEAKRLGERLTAVAPLHARAAAEPAPVPAGT